MDTRTTVNIRKDQDEQLLKIAAQRQVETGQPVGRSEIIREKLDQAFALSSISLAALQQVAKENGLETLDQAVEMLIKK